MPFTRKAVDTPFGLRPYDQVLRVTRYHKDSGGTAIYPGDPLIMEADGHVTIGDATMNYAIGVSAVYSANTTDDTSVLVYDDPEQLFYAQDDNAATEMTEAQIGNNVNLVMTTGDTTTLQSLVELDSSTATIGSGLAMKVIRLHPLESDSFASTVATNGQRKWVVKFNSHMLADVARTGV